MEIKYSQMLAAPIDKISEIWAYRPKNIWIYIYKQNIKYYSGFLGGIMGIG